MTMTIEQQAETIEALAPKLAAALGDKWEVRHDQHDRVRIAHVELPAYLTLVVGTYGQKPDSVRVDAYTTVGEPGGHHGYYPDDLRHEDGYRAMDLSANISTNKTPERIARDIERRVLPDVALLVSLAERKHARRAAHEAAVADQVNRTAAALGGTVRPRTSSRDASIDVPGVNARFEYASDRFVRMTLDLTADEWEAIGPTVREALAKNNK